MARQTYYVSRDQRHPLYKTRMLTAGQPLELDSGAAALYARLGVEMATEKPRGRIIPTVSEALKAEAVDEEARVAEAPKTRAPAKKRRTSKKKTA
jgi:hypothetical protein